MAGLANKNILPPDAHFRRVLSHIRVASINFDTLFILSEAPPVEPVCPSLSPKLYLSITDILGNIWFNWSRSYQILSSCWSTDELLSVTFVLAEATWQPWSESLQIESHQEEKEEKRACSPEKEGKKLG